METPLRDVSKQTVLNIFKLVQESWPKDTPSIKTEMMKKTAEVAGVSMDTVHNIIQEDKTKDQDSPLRRCKQMKNCTPKIKEQTKLDITKVYDFLEREYEELKKKYESLDLTPLSKFSQRTALATGASESLVLNIVQDKERRNTDIQQTESSSEENCSESNDYDGEQSRTVHGISNRDQTKMGIANVYHYFEKEYEELKRTYVGLDLTPLSNVHQRTALATGVSESTVLEILQEEGRRNTGMRQDQLRKQNSTSLKEESHEISNDKPEIYTELAVKIEPDDSGADWELPDPLITDVKLEPQDEEENNSDAKPAVHPASKRKRGATNVEVQAPGQVIKRSTRQELRRGCVIGRSPNKVNQNQRQVTKSPMKSPSVAARKRQVHTELKQTTQIHRVLLPDAPPRKRCAQRPSSDREPCIFVDPSTSQGLKKKSKLSIEVEIESNGDETRSLNSTGTLNGTEHLVVEPDTEMVAMAPTASATGAQVEALVDFMREHEDLARGLLRSTDGRVRSKQLWEKLCDSLNSMGGCTKSVEQWQRVWADRKHLAKKAAAAARRSAYCADGSSLLPPILSQMELKILSIMGEGFGERPIAARVPALPTGPPVTEPPNHAAEPQSRVQPSTSSEPLPSPVPKWTPSGASLATPRSPKHIQRTSSPRRARPRVRRHLAADTARSRIVELEEQRIIIETRNSEELSNIKVAIQELCGLVREYITRNS